MGIVIVAASMLAVIAGVSLAAALMTAREPAILARAIGSPAEATASLEPAPRLDPVGLLRRLGDAPGAAFLRVSPGLQRSLDLLGEAIDPALIRGARVAGLVAGVVLMIGTGDPLLGASVAILGVAAPPLVVARIARSRIRRIDLEVPQLLDLLAAASHAGLAGPLALRRAVDAIEGPLADELQRVLRGVELGGRWRDELASLAAHTGLPDLQRAVAALTRTERLGASLADAVTDLAARVRESRRAETTQRARTAPVKMLFPLVFLVLPAFLLLTVVPVLFSTVRSIG
ncbi:MAG: type II secretion system F family protein [Actinomycetota bacterium]